MKLEVFKFADPVYGGGIHVDFFKREIKSTGKTITITSLGNPLEIMLALKKIGIVPRYGEIAIAPHDGGFVEVADKKGNNHLFFGDHVLCVLRVK